MRRHQPADCSSSDDSDESDMESWFEKESEEGDLETDLTDVDTDIDIERDDEADGPWLLDEDKDYPPEYYLNQEELFDGDEFTDGNYSDSSMLLLDFIKERLH